jgi:hypothetical protein
MIDLGEGDETGGTIRLPPTLDMPRTVPDERGDPGHIRRLAALEQTEHLDAGSSCGAAHALFARTQLLDILGDRARIGDVHPAPPSRQPSCHHVMSIMKEYETMNIFTYKGYNGMVEIDPQAGILFGRVLDLDAVLTFEGDTVPEAEHAFHDTVDDYLDWCRCQRTQEPQCVARGSG